MDVLIVAVHSTWICLKSLAQNDECTLKVFLLQHVGDAHLVNARTRCGVEACGRSHHDGLALVLELLKTPAAELLAVVYRQLGYGVEGAHRYRRVDARYTVETVDETFAALYVFLVNVAVVVFWSVKRCLGYYLTKQRRREARLAQLHYGSTHLQVLRNQGSDADAALAVALGNGVDKYHVVLDSFKMAG